jgi:hypothetical protein
MRKAENKRRKKIGKEPWAQHAPPNREEQLVRQDLVTLAVPLNGSRTITVEKSIAVLVVLWLRIRSSILERSGPTTVTAMTEAVWAPQSTLHFQTRDSIP